MSSFNKFWSPHHTGPPKPQYSPTLLCRETDHSMPRDLHHLSLLWSDPVPGTTPLDGTWSLSKEYVCPGTRENVFSQDAHTDMSVLTCHQQHMAHDCPKTPGDLDYKRENQQPPNVPLQSQPWFGLRTDTGDWLTSRRNDWLNHSFDHYSIYVSSYVCLVLRHHTLWPDYAQGCQRQCRSLPITPETCWG